MVMYGDPEMREFIIKNAAFVTMQKGYVNFAHVADFPYRVVQRGYDAIRGRGFFTGH